jgi:hypothetical protein
VQGSAGAQGAQGVIGSTGSTGAQGAQGAQGVTGVTGVTGAQGAQGAQGLQGSQGSTGSQGAQGVQGSVGPQGSTGSQGLQGAQGAQGIRGSTGSTGSTGSVGSPGPQGSAGAQGAQGSGGAQGSAGPASVAEYPDLASFPSPSGSTNILYIAADTQQIYRWDGATYSVVSAYVDNKSGSSSPATNTVALRDIDGGLHGVHFSDTVGFTLTSSNSFTYGGIQSDKATVIQSFGTASTRGLIFQHSAHGLTGAAFGVSNNGKATIAHSLRVGYGENDSTVPGATYRLDISGDGSVSGTLTANHLTAVTKAFLINHPTKKGKKLQHGAVESPEWSVIYRGKTDKCIIKIPEYWKGLVRKNSVSVILTPINKYQKLFIIKQDNEKIVVGGVESEYNFMIIGERKDIEKLEVEI